MINKDYLEQFDGFIVTHSPVFCLLFEKFCKPIILINSCRYEQPFSWTNDIESWDWLNTKLKYLYLQYNLISELDPWYFFLEKILVINLSYNNISRFTNN
mgnify:CR=1 FL=1